MFEGKKPFIIRSNFNQNTEIKHNIYYELQNPLNMPKFNHVLKCAINDV